MFDAELVGPDDDPYETLDVQGRIGGGEPVVIDRAPVSVDRVVNREGRRRPATSDAAGWVAADGRGLGLVDGWSEIEPVSGP